MRRAAVPRPPARAQPLGLRSSCARCAPSAERSRCVCAVALPSRCALTSTLHSPEIEVMSWVPMAGRRQSGDPDLQSQRPAGYATPLRVASRPAAEVGAGWSGAESLGPLRGQGTCQGRSPWGRRRGRWNSGHTQPPQVSVCVSVSAGFGCVTDRPRLRGVWPVCGPVVSWGRLGRSAGSGRPQQRQSGVPSAPGTSSR